MRSVVVFGERKSGSGTLASWWIEHSKGRPFVVVRGEYAEVIDASRYHSEVDREGALRVADRFRTLVTADSDAAVEVAREGLKGALPDGQRLSVIFQGLDAWRPRYERIFEVLRNEIERTDGRLCLFASMRSVPSVKDRMSSLMVDVSDVHRIAFWSAERVQCVAKEVGLSMDDATAWLLCRRTGGQPKLVDLCVQRLAARGKEATERQIRAETEAMLWSPPAVVETWRADLEGVLRAKPELFPEFRAYVMGRRCPLEGRDAPPSRELPLYVSGWVGPSLEPTPERKTWGIRSWLHQAWARPILERVGGGR